MLQKLLSSIGIGSAQVDTVLENSVVVQGGTLRGEIRIYGGKLEQNIDYIDLSLYSFYKKEVGDNTVTLRHNFYTQRLQSSLTIKPDERKTIPLELVVPLDVPITYSGTRVFLGTDLGIDWAIDPSDQDALQVSPHPLLEQLLKSFSQLDFSQTRDSGKLQYHSWKGRPIQEFELRANRRGQFGNKLDELELYVLGYKDHFEVTLEIDRKGLLLDMIGLDEKHIKFNISSLDDVTPEKLRALIQSYT